MSLFLEAGEITPFGIWEPASQVCCYLTVRNPPFVKVDLLSQYLDIVLMFGELEFPLDPILTMAYFHALV